MTFNSGDELLTREITERKVFIGLRLLHAYFRSVKCQLSTFAATFPSLLTMDATSAINLILEDLKSHQSE